ncbi:MAG: iron donor protein CyaY [Candidatus Zeuxoniibacter abyssi]|nr:MAG: iron donor protein CyaY [Candidatus Persebacteraceae bacterium AB1(2)]
MNENDYQAACKELFERIEERLEETDTDYNNNGGVLEIEPETGGKIIINRQAPMREVWLAAKSGGRHFAFKNGEWIDTRDGRDFFAHLKEALEPENS